MALAETKGNIKGDLFDVFIDGTKGPFQATFSWNYTPNMHPVKTGRTGSSVVAHLLMGVEVGLEVTFQQMNLTELESLLATGGTAPRNVTNLDDTPTVFELKLRPAGAADDTDAIIVKECVVAGMRYDNDGQAERQLVVTFAAELNDSSVVMSIGPAS